MRRTIEDTLTDLDAMEAAAKRMGEVIYAKPYFRRLYDEALARVAKDHSPAVSAASGIYAGDPVEMVKAIRTALARKAESSDLPDTLVDGGPW